MEQLLAIDFDTISFEEFKNNYKKYKYLWLCYDDISSLGMDLGDDGISKNYQRKSEMIKNACNTFLTKCSTAELLDFSDMT